MTAVERAALDRLDEVGFAVVDDLVGGDDLEELRRAYDDVIDPRVLVPGDRQLGGIILQVRSTANSTSRAELRSLTPKPAGLATRSAAQPRRACALSTGL